VPITRIEGDSLEAEVLAVDRFGNVQLNVDPDEVVEWGGTLRVTAGSVVRTVSQVIAFEHIGSGLGFLIDSDGLLSVCANRSSAAEELGLGVGDLVGLSAADAPSPPSTPVALGQRVPSRGGSSEDSGGGVR